MSVCVQGYQGLRDRALSEHGILLQNIFDSSPRVGLFFFTEYLKCRMFAVQMYLFHIGV